MLGCGAIESLKARAAMCVAKTELAASELWVNGTGIVDPDVAAEARELGLALLAEVFGEQHRTWKKFHEVTEYDVQWLLNYYYRAA